MQLRIQGTTTNNGLECMYQQRLLLTFSCRPHKLNTSPIKWSTQHSTGETSLHVSCLTRFMSLHVSCHYTSFHATFCLNLIITRGREIPFEDQNVRDKIILTGKLCAMTIFPRENDYFPENLEKIWTK